MTDDKMVVPGDAEDSHRYIFVCGLHRSGTSLVHRCLRRHPDVSGFEDTGAPQDEGQHLQTVFPTAKSLGGPGRFGFNALAHLTEDSELITRENRHRLLEQWSQHWDTTKPYLLEKSPPNLVRTRFLQAVFPNSYLVVVIRHPIAAAFSTRKWSKIPLKELIKHWVICHECFEQDRSLVRRLHLMRYEDFVADADIAISGIYDFLGLARTGPGEEIASSLNDRPLEQWSAAAKSWWTRGKIREIQGRFEARVRPFGYTLAEPWYLNQ